MPAVFQQQRRPGLRSTAAFKRVAVPADPPADTSVLKKWVCGGALEAAVRSWFKSDPGVEGPTNRRQLVVGYGDGLAAQTSNFTT
jgi:hypothetical protein